jgi:hypothetical protein
MIVKDNNFGYAKEEMIFLKPVNDGQDIPHPWCLIPPGGPESCKPQ